METSFKVTQKEKAALTSDLSIQNANVQVNVNCNLKVFADQGTAKEKVMSDGNVYGIASLNFNPAQLEELKKVSVYDMFVKAFEDAKSKVQ